MNKFLLAVCLAGCAFYEKKYVSRIVIDGTNYRGTVYSDGVFYLDSEPNIVMRMGCFNQTSLGETVSLLIPFPVLNGAKPHDSIGRTPFSLTV